MRAARAPATILDMKDTIETTTSVTVIHGAMLSFESIAASASDEAPLRLREQHETLLRIVDGSVILELDGTQRTMQVEDEARIPASTAHRIWNGGDAEARIVQELRRVG